MEVVQKKQSRTLADLLKKETAQLVVEKRLLAAFFEFDRLFGAGESKEFGVPGKEFEKSRIAFFQALAEPGLGRRLSVKEQCAKNRLPWIIRMTPAGNFASA